MSRHIVKIKLKANTDDNPRVTYFKSKEPNQVFQKYLDEGKMHILQDIIGDGEREIWYSYESTEIREQVRKELEQFGDSYKNDVELTILQDG